MDRNEELARGLEKLHNDMSHITQHIERIQRLVPVFDFGDMLTSDEASEDALREGMGASPPIEMGARDAQLPLFEVEYPVTFIFENVYINGEKVDMNEEGDIDGSD